MEASRAPPGWAHFVRFYAVVYPPVQCDEGVELLATYLDTERAASEPGATSGLAGSAKVGAAPPEVVLDSEKSPRSKEGLGLVSQVPRTSTHSHLSRRGRI
jgi:hypothetical protein